MPTYDVDDVCNKLDRLEKAVESNTESRKWVLFWWLLFAFGWAIVSGIFSGVWHSKTRYVIQYGVSYDQVVEEDTTGKHDCRFITAPIGEKWCHYDIDVTTVRTNISAEGKPIVSYDEGKTWTLDSTTNPTRPSVRISWVRIEE